MSQTPHELQNFLSRLKGVKRQGEGYMACCPAHDDRNPSLSISCSEDSKILINCFAGCEDKDILTILGLKMSDLFIGKADKPPTVKSEIRYCYYF